MLRLNLSMPLIFFSLSCAAQVSHFDFRDLGERNVISFNSEGTLQRTLGLSHFISGWADLDPQNLSQGIHAQVESDIRGFQTGNDSIDFNLIKWFNVNQSPIATFTLEQATHFSKNALKEGQPVTFRAEGKLALNGKVQSQSALVTLSLFKASTTTEPQRLPGNVIKMDADLEIDVETFGITIPRDQSDEFSKYFQLTVSGEGTDHSPAMAGKG